MTRPGTHAAGACRLQATAKASCAIEPGWSTTKLGSTVLWRPGPQESFECRLVVYDRPGEEPLTSVVEHFGGMFFLADVQANPNVHLLWRN